MTSIKPADTLPSCSVETQGRAFAATDSGTTMLDRLRSGNRALDRLRLALELDEAKFAIRDHAALAAGVRL